MGAWRTLFESAGMAEVHELPDRVVLKGLDQRTGAIPRDLEITDEPQVGAVEVHQLGGDPFDALDGVNHPVCRQVVSARERHYVPILAVLIRVPRRRCNWLASLLIGVDPLPLKCDLGRIVAD